MICINPNSQIIPYCIIMVNYTIAIFIKVRQCFKTRNRNCAIRKFDLITEKLTAIVNFTITIAIKTKETILKTYQCCLFSKTILI